MADDDDGEKKLPAENVHASDGPVVASEDAEPSGAKTSDAPTQEPPEADEFGLPLKPPRRRQYEDSEEGDAREDGGAAQASVLPVSEVRKSSEAREVDTVPDESTTDKVVNGVWTPEADAASSEDQAVPGSRHEEALDRVNELMKTESAQSPTSPERRRQSAVVSEWSHQQLAPQPRPEEDDEEARDEKWQEMPALATFRQYDDWGKVTAKAYDEVDDDQAFGYSGLGGAGRGYTRVQIDDDAQSATSMDENTAYLFKGAEKGEASNTVEDDADDEDARDMVTQMQATKQMLTEGQRIAYVGVVRLSMAQMRKDMDALEKTRGSKKAVEFGMESLKMWAQKMMVRVYAHMEIDSAEQIMVEQLAEHGVISSDMTPILMQNARVKNPQQQKPESKAASISSTRQSLSSPRPSSSKAASIADKGGITKSAPGTPALAPTTPGTPVVEAAPPTYEQDVVEAAPPTYEQATVDELTIKDPMSLDSSKDIDLDLRWTVLCDLLLLLIADSTYDARSRTLLELVGKALSVEWQEICRFEKRVTDAVEMQEQAEKETWNEDEHLEGRRKKAMKKRLMIMGLCTVGGGLVIGLSAGLLAPVIGAGLAAGFTTIGVTGTTGFLGGAGGAAIIGTTGVLTGGTVGVRAANRRTGAVRTFEYRPLHNNKRVNLIVTVAGWMTGKVDDVRLPFSTIDPIMGDIYSVHWEPEMLQSTGQTINILATEALTQTIQQILGSTILTGLMAGLSLPIVLTKLSYLVDNPWSVSLARADSAGLIMADSIIDRNLGVRPITLVGYSLGSRVIFSCLRELAARGGQGLVQNVFLFGTPVVAKKDEYLRARTVVSGRFVNGYSTNDWILGYLFRATGGGLMRVAGLNTVEVSGIENINVTETVPGHMAYRGKMPVLLRECGWMVESDEFSEIEDPDPDNHEVRQRELISEIEAARQELEEKERGGEKKKGLKGWFSRGQKKAAVKKDWETYDPKKVAAAAEANEDPEKVASENLDVMFDVDAIRREALALAMQGVDVKEITQHMQIKEIASTMPMMRVSSTPNTPQLKHGGSELGSAPGTPALSKSVNGLERDPLEDAVSLSFDTDERPPLRSLGQSNGHASSGYLSPAFQPGSARPSSELPTPPEQTHNRPKHSFGSRERPRLKSTDTSPARQASPSTQNATTGGNVWADDEDFGKEKEVSLTFD